MQTIKRTIWTRGGLYIFRRKIRFVEKHLADVNTIGSSKYLPEYDMFISAVNGRETRFDVAERNGLYLLVTYGKVQTSDISFNKITDLDITVTRQIIALEKKKRIILTAEYADEHGNSALYRPFFAYSDDGGKLAHYAAGACAAI